MHSLFCLYQFPLSLSPPAICTQRVSEVEGFNHVEVVSKYHLQPLNHYESKVIHRGLNNQLQQLL